MLSLKRQWAEKSALWQQSGLSNPVAISSN